MITENSNEENQILGTHDKNVDVTCYINASKSEKRDTKQNSNSSEQKHNCLKEILLSQVTRRNCIISNMAFLA